MAEAVGADEKVTYRSVLRDPDIRVLAASRATSKLASSTVSYGSMVFLATAAAAQWQISLVAASTYLAALLFGLQGGQLSDKLSKRSSILVGYIGQAALCILVPILFGTDIPQLMAIMFFSSALMQLISPALKSSVALVAAPSEMATVSATISVVGSTFSALGSSLLAPILIKTTSIEVLMLVCGGLYVLGAFISMKIPAEPASCSLGEAVRSIEWKPTFLSKEKATNWITNYRALASMLLVGCIVVALFEAFNTLIPVYVRDVLHSDPTNAVYIFAPAGLGFLLGTFLTPPLIRRWGERKLANIAVICMTISMMLFGLIDLVAPVLAPISPLRLLQPLLDQPISDAILAASVIAIPANFGSTAAGASIQTYINKSVGVDQQGSVFGIQKVQENALTLAAILLLGVVSSFLNPKAVFVVAPLLVVGLVLLLIRYAYDQAPSGTEYDDSALEALTDDAGDLPPEGSAG